MKLFEDLKNVVAAAEADAIKFYDKGNAAAGKRLRAKMQALKGLATDIRKDVQERKKGIQGA